MKTNLLKTFAIGTMFLMLIGGCSDTAPAYSHFEQIGSDGWESNDVLLYEPWPADSAAVTGRLYDFDLVMRYSARVRPARLPMAILFEDGDGVISADTLVIDAGARSESKPGIREVTIPLRDGVKLTEGMRVSVSNLAAPERAKGLLNVGIIMKEATK